MVIDFVGIQIKAATKKPWLDTISHRELSRKIAFGLLELEEAPWLFENIYFRWFQALFVGGVTQSKKIALMITSCEIYARDANIDEHLESNCSTFPYTFEANSRRYEGITIKIN